MDIAEYKRRCENMRLASHYDTPLFSSREVMDLIDALQSVVNDLNSVYDDMNDVHYGPGDVTIDDYLE